MTEIIVQLNPDTPPTGTDISIVNAARRSFGKRSDWDYTCACGIKKDPEAQYNKWPGCGADQMDCHREVKSRTLKPADKRLLEFLARGMTADDFEMFVADASGGDYEDLVGYLWDFRNTPIHDTPFNHTFISFEVKCPLFVHGQLVKHEYLPMSTFSRRYITDEIEFYKHTYRQAAVDKKQGSGGPMSEKDQEWLQKVSEQAAWEAVCRYNTMIEAGVAPEQARGELPQNLMTSFTWSGTLGAFAKMCQLRLHPDAQKEAKIVAEAIYAELKKQWPVSAPLLVEGVF